MKNFCIQFQQFRRLTISVLLLICLYNGQAQNPLIHTQYTADPSARVFGNRIYLFPSHDILATEGKGRKGWFCMEDYHVFSSADFSEWTDHGIIITQNKVPWVRPDSYSMWAPDCIERNGKYYFYFPSAPADTATYGRGFTIGVAVADKPEGPYTAEPTPVKGVHGIDPNVFIDKDGQAYLYWSAGNIYGAKLKDNMKELASEVKILGELPTKGLKEGPWLFEREGVYYLTYPHVANKTEQLEYAISDNPLGPFKVTGVIMDESATGCWTNHHSILHFNNQWYLFYHHNDYSPSFDKARSARADSLFFNEDKTIRKVIPTYRGIGSTNARSIIQIDRYSAISPIGTAISSLDTSNRFAGWKTTLSAPGAWIQYNSVDFNKNKTIQLNAISDDDAIIEIRTGQKNGPLIATVKLAKSYSWKISTSALSKRISGKYNLFILLKSNTPVSIDWIRFE
jgi:hypothetical protein